MGLSRDPLLTAGVPDRLSCTAAWGDDIVKFLLWMCWCWEWVGVSGFNRVPDRVPGKVPGKVPGRVPGRVPGKVPGRVQNENTIPFFQNPKIRDFSVSITPPPL